MKKIVAFPLFLFACGWSPAAYSQVIASSDSSIIRPAPRPVVRRPKPITKEMSAGLRLNSDGWTVVVESGKVKSEDSRRMDMFHDVRILQFEFSVRKHPKELRIYGFDPAKDQFTDKQYIFGKVNNFFALKFNYGYRKMIGGKPFANTVSVHWIYAGGLALGLLKPYYVQASGPMGQADYKFSKETESVFLNQSMILGSSGFGKGIGEIKLKPGIHLKTGLHFDFAKDKFAVAAIECGASAEIYASKMEIMANLDAKPYFFNLYAGIQLGKRRR